MQAPRQLESEGGRPEALDREYWASMDNERLLDELIQAVQEYAAHEIPRWYVDGVVDEFKKRL